VEVRFGRAGVHSRFFAFFYSLFIDFVGSWPPMFFLVFFAYRCVCRSAVELARASLCVSSAFSLFCPVYCICPCLSVSVMLLFLICPPLLIRFVVFESWVCLL